MLGNLGVAYADLGDARRAIAYYEQRLAIAREFGDRRGEAIGSWNLGLVFEQQGDLARGSPDAAPCGLRARDRAPGCGAACSAPRAGAPAAAASRSGRGGRHTQPATGQQVAVAVAPQGALERGSLRQRWVAVKRQIGHSKVEQVPAHLEQSCQRLQDA